MSKGLGPRRGVPLLLRCLSAGRNCLPVSRVLDEVLINESSYYHRGVHVSFRWCADVSQACNCFGNAKNIAFSTGLTIFRLMK